MVNTIQRRIEYCNDKKSQLALSVSHDNLHEALRRASVR
jgi:hypothetical protein